MKQEPQKWLKLEEGDFTIVLPDYDSKPHAHVKPGMTKAELAGFDCPCKPESQILEDGSILISHNSFLDMTKVKNAMKKLDSNSIGTDIHQVCSPCGISANVLTCLKKYGKRPDKLCYSVSTFHTGLCDFCKTETSVTQTRDFFHPDFSLLAKKIKSK